MQYRIKFIKILRKLSIFSVNDIELHFVTTSEREVESSLNEMENILKNNLKLNCYEDLLSDTFRAIEFFSITDSGLVKDYFSNLKNGLMSTFGKTVHLSRLSCIKYLIGVSPDHHDFDNKIKLFIRANLQEHTQFIFYNVFDAANKKKESYINTLSETYKPLTETSFKTSIGNLIYLGPRFAMHLWEIKGSKQEIFWAMTERDVLSLADKITRSIDHIHNVISNYSTDYLIDFTDTDEIRVLQLYSKVNTALLKSYLFKRVRAITEQRIRIGTGNWGKASLTYLLCKDKTRSTDYYGVKICSKYIDTLTLLFDEIINTEAKEQIDYLLTSNEFSLDSDRWKYYCMVNNTLQSLNLDFSMLRNSMLKREVKLYYKNLITEDLKTKNTLRKDKSFSRGIENYSYIVKIAHYLLEYKKIEKAADLSVDILIELIEEIYMTRLLGTISGTNNASIVENVYYGLKSFLSWVIENSDNIRTTKPNIALLHSLELNKNNIVSFGKRTDIIPEIVIEQIRENLHKLKPEPYKRLFLIFINSPRRFNEIQKADIDCIQPLVIDDIEQYDEDGNPLFILTFIEHKKHMNDTIKNNGLDYSDYTENIVVNYIVAREIYEQMDEVKRIEEDINKNNSSNKKIEIQKLFVTKNEMAKEGYNYITSQSFVRKMNGFIKMCDIRNTDGQLWNFSAKQTRKTSSYLSLVNGASLNELQELLCHVSIRTTQKFYTEINELLISDANTEYLKKEFDERLFSKDKDKFSAEELDILFQQFCLESRKIYYNRKMLGVCTLTYGKSCPHSLNSNDAKDDFPCSSCPDLLTSKSCRESWVCLKNEQEEKLKLFEQFMECKNINKADLEKFPEYRYAKTKYLKTIKVISAIDAY